MDDIYENVPEHLKCPICFEVPVDKIFQCQVGHVLCEECFVQLKECPQCRSPFKEKIRNRVLEDLLDALKVDCPFKSSGCTEKIGSRKNVKKHLAECWFNRSKATFVLNFCQLIGIEKCLFQLKLDNTAELLRHLVESHHVQVEKNKSSLLKLSAHSKKNYIVQGAVYNPDKESYSILILAIFDKMDNSAALVPMFIPSKYSEASYIEQINSGLQVEFVLKAFNITGNMNDPSASSNPFAPIPLKWSVAPIDIFKADQIFPYLLPFRLPLPLLEKYFDYDGCIQIRKTVVDGRNGTATLSSSEYYTAKKMPSGIFVNRNSGRTADELYATGRSQPLQQKKAAPIPKPRRPMSLSGAVEPLNPPVPITPTMASLEGIDFSTNAQGSNNHHSSLHFWKCRFCTFPNSNEETLCEICGRVKVSPNSIETNSEVANNDDRALSVECPRCTLLNSSSATSCAVCSLNLKVKNYRMQNSGKGLIYTYK